MRTPIFVTGEISIAESEINGHIVPVLLFDAVLPRGNQEIQASLAFPSVEALAKLQTKITEYEIIKSETGGRS